MSAGAGVALVQVGVLRFSGRLAGKKTDVAEAADPFTRLLGDGHKHPVRLWKRASCAACRPRKINLHGRSVEAFERAGGAAAGETE